MSMDPEAMSDRMEEAAWLLAEAGSLERAASAKRMMATKLIASLSAEFRGALMEAKEKRLERIISKL